jgi:outer membrane protein assembly factor BamB
MWTGSAGLGQAMLEAFDATGVAGCAGAPKVSTPAWSMPVRATDRSPAPTVSGGKVFVLGNFTDQLSNPPGQRGAWLEAHDAATGALVWRAHYSGPFVDTMTIHAGRLYVGAGLVDVYDAAGVQGCHRVVGLPGVSECAPVLQLLAPDLTAPLAIADGVLYTGGYAGIEGSVPGFKAYDAAALTPACRNLGGCPPAYQAPSISTATSMPAIVDGLVFVATVDGTLHVFSLH